MIHRRKNGVNAVGGKKMKQMQLLVPGPATLASIESLAIPLVQEVVILADFRCKKCQQRVEAIMSKMNCETESMVVDVFNKRVTLTCRLLPMSVKNSSPQVTLTSWISLHKVTPFRRFFTSSCSSQ